MERKLSAAIAALGCTSLVTQTILLREFLAIFAGNELVIGVVLANWMILTGAGALLGRLSGRITTKQSFATTLLLLIAVLPTITVFLLRSLRNVVFPVGSIIGIIQSAYSSFILLIPFCLVSGFLFSLLAQIVSDRTKENRIARVYSLEAIGSIVGGLVFNLVAVFLLTTFQSLILLALLDLAVCAALAASHGGRVLMSSAAALSAFLLIVMVVLDPDQVTRQLMFKGQSLLYQKDTPYGSIAVTKEGGQTSFFENSVLLFSTDDITTNEEAVHYAMIQHPHPGTVLIMSGGTSGMAREVFKYGVGSIDYVEINPSIIEAGRRLTSALDDRRIHVIPEDARRYLRTCVRKYDVVLLNTPDPGTAQVNRYYTVEFFHELKACMDSGAVLSLSLLSAADYFGPDARLVSSSVYRSLKTAFRNVLVIPGNRNFFIASDNDLSINVSHMIAARGIPTTYVNKDYIDDQLLGQRSEQITRSLDMTADLNRDFSPVAYYRQMRYWLGYFSFNPWIPAVIGGAILIGVLFRLNPVSAGMLTGGFAASSVELLLIVSFQMIYGFVYQATGVIMTVFMAGLAVGSRYGDARLFGKGRKAYAAIQGVIGIYCLLLPPVLMVLKDMDSDGIVYVGFALLTMIMGLLVGIEFSMAAKLLRGNVSAVASTLYGVDLVGSAIGALFVAVYLLPLLGLGLTCAVIGSASLISALVSRCGKGMDVARADEGASYV